VCVCECVYVCDQQEYDDGSNKAQLDYTQGRSGELDLTLCKAIACSDSCGTPNTYGQLVCSWG
jgi:hypothetical protein